jgi:alginate O-acetyltransferase complex protein AlgI
VALGVSLVALGLVKKVVADNMTAYVAHHLPHFSSTPLSIRWLVFAAISLRILLDFSGYSDMAIGLARMLGVQLPANFNWPYLAVNLTEFWRRWHVSLSTWIRDYVYIPLGGSRRGTTRKVFNGLLAFGLCGLWHGAAWHFILWGVYHGAGLAICSGYRSALGRAGDALARWFERYRVAAHALTLSFVCVGWLFFFYPVPVALQILKLLFETA